MKRRIYWGVAILILLLGTAAVFVIMPKLAENSELNEQLKEAEELANQIKQRKIDENNPPSEEPISEEPISEEPISDPIEPQDVQVSAVPDKKAQQNDNTDIKPRNYVEIDYSILDNPEEAIRRQAEILLNPDKYSLYEYAKASQEASILSRKILDGYYGKGEYFENLWEFRDEILVNPRLAKQGLSIEMLDSMIRGEIPPMVIPMDSADLDTNGGRK